MTSSYGNTSREAQRNGFVLDSNWDGQHLVYTIEPMSREDQAAFLAEEGEEWCRFSEWLDCRSIASTSCSFRKNPFLAHLWGETSVQMTRGYRTELDLNNKQITACKKHAGAARYAYNWGLKRKQEVYQTTGRRISAMELHRELNHLKQSEL